MLAWRPHLWTSSFCWPKSFTFLRKNILLSFSFFYIYLCTFSMSTSANISSRQIAFIFLCFLVNSHLQWITFLLYFLGLVGILWLVICNVNCKIPSQIESMHTDTHTCVITHKSLLRYFFFFFCTWTPHSDVNTKNVYYHYYYYY